jgi:acyl-CoA thioesterase-1
MPPLLRVLPWALATSLALLAACGSGDSTGAMGGTDPTAESVEEMARKPGSKRPRVSPVTWAVIGSSTAAGAGATTKSWVAALGDTYAGAGVSIVNLAEGGTTTYHGLPSSSPLVPNRPAPSLRRNVDAALGYSPTVLLVSYPTNDTAYGYAVSETVGNLSTIRDYARARGVGVIVLSTQPRALSSTQLAQLVQIDEGVSGAASPCFVAVREALAGPDGRLAPAYDSGDGIHPNDAGHALIHSRVVALIDSGACVPAPVR